MALTTHNNSKLDFLSGGSEMGALMRKYAWPSVKRPQSPFEYQ